MKENVARRPRFKRTPDSRPLRLTPRDEEIISTVRRYRFMTTGQILRLTHGSAQNLKRRLQRLYHSGFLDRPAAQFPLRFAEALSEIVYSLPLPGKSAATSLFLSHSLLISEALTRIEAWCKKTNAKFVPETELVRSASREDSLRRVQWRVTVLSGGAHHAIGVIPDATFAIERLTDRRVHRRHFFLEVDKGTMPLHRRSLQLSSIHRKALAYCQSYRIKVPQERFGFAGFQVLFVSCSTKRLKNIKAYCDNVTDGHASLFVFADNIESLQRALGHNS